MPEQTIEGLDELEKKMLKMETKTAAKALRLALRKIALPIAAKVISNAPERTGALRKSIRVSSSTGTGKKGTNSARARVLIGGKATKKRLGSFHAASVELGTSKRTAHPFVRPAFDSEVNQAITSFGEILAVNIIKAAGANNGK